MLLWGLWRENTSRYKLFGFCFLKKAILSNHRRKKHYSICYSIASAKRLLNIDSSHFKMNVKFFFIFFLSFFFMLSIYLNHNKCLILDTAAYCSLVVISALRAALPLVHVYTGQTTPCFIWKYIFHHVLFYNSATYHMLTCASCWTLVCWWTQNVWSGCRMQSSAGHWPHYHSIYSKNWKLIRDF